MKTGVVNCITVKGNIETLVFIVFFFRLFTFTSILLIRIVCIFFLPRSSELHERISKIDKLRKRYIDFKMFCCC